MAACRLGSTNVQITKIEFTRERPGNLSQTCWINSWGRQKPARFTSLVLPRRSPNPLTVRCSSSSGTEAVNIEDDTKGKKSVAMPSQTIPNAFEVQSLVTQICDTASIAEFELKYGGFQLYVIRDLAQKYKPSPPPISPPVVANTPVESPDSNGSVSTRSLAISKSSSPLGEKQTLQEKATDEGLVILQSPRVGFFRRSRTIKGKRAPPSCKEKQSVKEGQVLCYIEQLGGELPIESDVSGEVVKILKKDGDPVGYGDSLLTILPSFPGIKKLQ